MAIAQIMEIRPPSAAKRVLWSNLYSQSILANSDSGKTSDWGGVYVEYHGRNWQDQDFEIASPVVSRHQVLQLQDGFPDIPRYWVRGCLFIWKLFASSHNSWQLYKQSIGKSKTHFGECVKIWNFP